MTLEALALQGANGIYENLAATVTGKIHEFRRDDLRECFTNFNELEHRLESVATVHGIQFINDSRSSTINGSWFALESMYKPVIWIAGGVDSGNDYSIVRSLVKRKVKVIICLGKDNSRLHQAFEDLELPLMDTTSMEEAVQAAYYMSEKGYAVLLSPACASFDLFKNFEDRGNAFIRAVKNL
jgi:UDP-N-acetylmuramoylalanine--D-glutamate ligase